MANRMGNTEKMWYRGTGIEVFLGDSLLASNDTGQRETETQRERERERETESKRETACLVNLNLASETQRFQEGPPTPLAANLTRAPLL
jgi:hypothetical protein